MAKIKTLKYEIKGTEYNINVNCTSQGMFTANLPDEVYKTLDLRKRLECATFDLLVSDLNEAVDRYKKAETMEELFIMVRYQASGLFQKKGDGTYLFNGYKHPMQFEKGFNTSSNVLGFEYKVVVKRTVDGTVKYHETYYGYKDIIDREEGEEKAYHMLQNTYSEHRLSEWKKIPYSKFAVETLDKILERIRAASETLFNFVSQDEEAIEHMLVNRQLNLMEGKDGK